METVFDSVLIFLTNTIKPTRNFWFEFSTGNKSQVSSSTSFDESLFLLGTIYVKWEFETFSISCFRLSNTLLLPTTPGESYDLEITLLGRGSIPLQRTVDGILFHCYPSTISENAAQRDVTSHSIAIVYSTIGIFLASISLTGPTNVLNLSLEKRWIALKKDFNFFLNLTLNWVTVRQKAQILQTIKTQQISAHQLQNSWAFGAFLS